MVVSVSERAAAGGYGPPAARTVAVAGAAVVAWLGAPLAGCGAWAWPALAAGMVLASLMATAGALRVRRGQICHLAMVDAAPIVGGRQVPHVVARRWSRRWPGVPHTVVIGFDPAASQTAPTWGSDVASVISRAFGASYRLHRGHRRTGRLAFIRTTSPAGTHETTESPEARARRIVADLIPPATVESVEADVNGAVTALTVSYQSSARLVASGYRARVEATISATLPGRWRGWWDLEADRVRFEQRPIMPECIWVRPPQLPPGGWRQSYESLSIPLGVDEDGHEVAWRPAVVPQALIVGGTGSGKTTVAHNILVHVAVAGCPVWVADGKAIEFLGFRDWPNVQIVASTIETQVAVIHRAWQLMEHRYQLLTTGGTRVADFEPLFVFLDEFADLKGNLLNWYTSVKAKGDPTKPATLAEAASLMRKARSARIHVVTATQRADAEILGGEMRENQGMRISVGRISPDSAQMMWANPTVGVALPRATRGRAVAGNADGDPVEIQCYRAPDPAKVVDDTPEAELAAALRPSVAVQDRLVIMPPEPVDGGSPSFGEYADASWVKATDRPDVDPLRGADDSGPAGRQSASPLAVLGLSQSHADASLPSQPVGVTTTADGEFGEQLTPALVPAGHLTAGDLIDVGDDQWAVATSDAAPALDMPGADVVAVPWRSEDTDGELTTGADEPMRVYRIDDEKPVERTHRDA